ncbi:MAG: response regulator [Elusimicrobia bacterium]|nr:response regulator [Elusimicrobiota bacterium]
MAKERILVIDDEKPILEFCRKILRKNGYDVEIAEGGEEGLKKVKDDTFDLIILDWHMPNVNGIEVLRNVKKDYPKVEVIMMTAYGTIASAVEAMKAGAYDYLVKPFEITDLISVVQRCLEKRRLKEEVEKLKEMVSVHTTIRNMIVTLNHEMNQPLTVLQSTIQLMMERTIKGERPNQEAMKKAEKQCKRLSEILQKISKIKQIKTKEYIKGTDMVDLDESSTE